MDFCYIPSLVSQALGFSHSHMLLQWFTLAKIALDLSNTSVGVYPQMLSLVKIKGTVRKYKQ